MNVIIIGAGKVGFSMAQLLSDEGNDVVVIETVSQRGAQVNYPGTLCSTIKGCLQKFMISASSLNY